MNGYVKNLYVINEENKLVLGNFGGHNGYGQLWSVYNVNCIVDASHSDDFEWRIWSLFKSN